MFRGSKLSVHGHHVFFTPAGGFTLPQFTKLVAYVTVCTYQPGLRPLACWHNISDHEITFLISFIETNNKKKNLRYIRANRMKHFFYLSIC